MRAAGKGKSKVTEGEGDNEFWKLLGAAPGAAVFFFLKIKARAKEKNKRCTWGGVAAPGAALFFLMPSCMQTYVYMYCYACRISISL